jgi:hypothetical protein
MLSLEGPRNSSVKAVADERFYRPDALKEFGAPKTAADVRDLLAESIIEIRAGKLDPKVANALGYLGTSLLSALEVADVERRLDLLERESLRVEDMVFQAGDPMGNHNGGEKITMPSIQERLDRLEDGRRFIAWFVFERLLDSLTLEQLETYARNGRWPGPLPEPLPRGASRLDGLDRKSLIKRWKESERMFRHRSQDEIPFYGENRYWPEQRMRPRYYLQDGCLLSFKPTPFAVSHRLPVGVVVTTTMRLRSRRCQWKERGHRLRLLSAIIVHQCA